MQLRPFSTTGLSLSVIGLGTWAIGGGDWKFGWGDQDEQEAISAVTRAVELGINWIDTAAIYGEGRSEELVGRALQQIPRADRPLIATKCGRVPVGNGEIEKRLKRDSVLSECEASLRRLRVECIDLYQLHWPEPDEDIEEAWQALVELRQQGKVRFIGVSNHSVQQMERLQPISPIVSLQPPYSMIARDVETTILPWCAKHAVSVICYSPMGKGLLTGTFTHERIASMSTKDHRTRDPRFCPPQLDINLDFAQKLKSVADGLGWTVAELAIAWTLRRPEVTSAIVGARSGQQIEQTAIAGTRRVTTDVEATIESLLTDRARRLSELS